ncbi:MAG TPA: molybdopterin-binding protein [Euzebyales bacterium]|nr:molybdopterin-binding protein [Euzebyales bacterium]
MRASIVVIGDEILDGFVRDSNAGWLAQRLDHIGIGLDRIVVVPDDVAAIVEALDTELARPRPRVVFTSGGIGTTPDDRTMAAVASYLQVDLVGEPTLLRMVDGILARLDGQGHTVDAAQRSALGKLARVPRGARALTGPGGGAPAVRIDLGGGPDADGGAVIVVLPGVPGQFRGLVEDLETTLLAGRGVPRQVVELRHPYPESVLTPTLELLERQLPGVDIGSYPGPECVLRVKGPPETVRRAVTELERVIAGLQTDPVMQRLAASWRRGWDGE